MKILAILASICLAACASLFPSNTNHNKLPSTSDSTHSSSYEKSIPAKSYDLHNCLAVGYCDFNNDGREDLLMAWVSGSLEKMPIEMFLQDSTGNMVRNDSLLPIPIPGTVHARKIIVDDFNNDGIADTFIVDHGYDHPPFPGAKPILLLSSGMKYSEIEIKGIPTGFQHSATAADINGDGAPDIFVTDTTNGAFLLMNDGLGKFVVTRYGIPTLKGGYFTSEFIDMDNDGYFDLLVGGHEHEGATTYVYWGDASGRYSASRSTRIPEDADYRIVLDFDAEDLDGDGIRELILTRTKSNPFYEGYYFQMLKLTERHFTDISSQIVPEKRAWEGSTSEWVPYIVLRDFDKDGDKDIVMPDKSRCQVYINNGKGEFSRKKSGPWE